MQLLGNFDKFASDSWCKEEKKAKENNNNKINWGYKQLDYSELE